MARLLSVSVGLPHDIEWRGRTVHTGIWKEPVRGRRGVKRLNVDGDGQGDLGGHGGEQRAGFLETMPGREFWALHAALVACAGLLLLGCRFAFGKLLAPDDASPLAE